MALKKDSWIVRSVLVIAVVAFIAVPLVIAFGSRPARDIGGPQQPTPDQTAQLQGEIDGYSAVLSREPDNQNALRGIIEARIALGDLEGTVEPLERLVELNPQVPDYAVALAQTKQQLQDLEGAAQVYRRVLTDNPGNVLALEGLVSLLLSQGRSEAAVGLLRDTLTTADQTNELNPGSIDKLSLKLLLGQVLVQDEQFDEALTLYDEAIADAAALSPEQPDFRPTLAKALVLQEQGDAGAQALFDQALEMAPAEYKDGVRELMADSPPDASAPAAEGEAAGEPVEDGAAAEEEVPVAP